jgi:Tfp pilus assembly protein PilO
MHQQTNMNRNTTAIILIVLAIAIYFTFTSGKIEELKAIQSVNAQYQEAIDNAGKLVEVRDSVLSAYNSISETDRQRLNKLVPDNVDNVRLIIDVKDDIAARHGLVLKSIKTASPEAGEGGAGVNPETGEPLPVSSQDKYGVVSLSFSVTTSYENFLNFLKDLEASLRIMDVSKLTIVANDQGTYDFGVEVKTYWLKQK